MLASLLLLACTSDKALPAERDTAGDADSTPADTEPPDSPPAHTGRDTGRDTDLDTAPPGPLCPDAQPEDIDWTEPGPWPVGVRDWEGTLEYSGLQQHLLQLVYPATAEGLDAPLDPSGGPYPLLVFEHAYGSAYDQYRWLFDALASRGWIIASAEHDANGWNSAGDWWEAHAWLAGQTAELLVAWSADPGSEWYGSVDLDRVALGGHSHGGGGVLRLAQSWRPMDPEGPYEARAVVLITTRPDRDSDYSSYAATYVDSPPTLNIGGGMDQDGTTAYGQSIAIYEGRGRPGGMIYVEGAEHYSFTDTVNDGYATLPRAAAQQAGARAILSFLAATVEGDAGALAAWRGDAAALPLDASQRVQWHDASAAVLDAFESSETSAVQSGAIVGIPGQTYVNGFLGDSLADRDAQVALITAQIEDLAPAGGRALFFQDASRGVDTYALALAGADALSEVVSVSSELDFVERLAEGGWDLVVATKQDGSSSAGALFDADLAAWICAGGRAILSDFRVYSAGAQATFACAGASFDGTTNWSQMTSTGALFEGALASTNPGWGIYTYGLGTTGTTWAENEVEVPGPVDPSLSDAGGAVSAAGMDTFQEIEALSSARALYMPTQALEIAWSAAGASVTWEVGEGEGLDVTERPVLSLRLLAVHGDEANPEADRMDFTVEITDLDGDAARWSLSQSAQGALRPTPEWLDYTVPKSVFETWRVPLRALADAAPALDLARVAAVTLIAEEPAGRALVDDLEWSAGEGCW